MLHRSKFALVSRPLFTFLYLLSLTPLPFKLCTLSVHVWGGYGWVSWHPHLATWLSEMLKGWITGGDIQTHTPTQTHTYPEFPTLYPLRENVAQVLLSVSHNQPNISLEPGGSWTSTKRYFLFKLEYKSTGTMKEMSHHWRSIYTFLIEEILFFKAEEKQNFFFKSAVFLIFSDPTRCSHLAKAMSGSSYEGATRWTISILVLVDLQVSCNKDWQCLTSTHTQKHTYAHIHSLRHALSSNTLPVAEGRLAHLWLLTPGVNHLITTAIALSFYSSDSSTQPNYI